MNFFEQLGANIRDAQAETAARVAMGHVMAEEERITVLFASLEGVAAGVDRTVPRADGIAALDALLESLKRALINPKSEERAALVRAIARFENVRTPQPADPEVDK